MVLGYCHFSKSLTALLFPLIFFLQNFIIICHLSIHINWDCALFQAIKSNRQSVILPSVILFNVAVQSEVSSFLI